MDTMKKSSTVKMPVIVDYNPEWARFYNQEAEKIQETLATLCSSIHHVGSTSVVGLAAKPIIDMILVTSDLEETKIFLVDILGYRYKGEYNLPLRDLYGKKGVFEIYLHVHLVGSGEIALNLKFRDFLRTNDAKRDEYQKIKIQASKEPSSGEKVSTGVTQYNLYKNDFITAALKAVEFGDLCVRFATQEAECLAFDLYKKQERGLEKGVSDAGATISKNWQFILFKGTEIIGAAEISDLVNGYLSLGFIKVSSDMADTIYDYFFSFIEKWAKRKKVRFITTYVFNEKRTFM